MLLILAAMIMIKGAFTLPGLAGLVLTVGMAVDANVLINERIRESASGSSNATRYPSLCCSKTPRNLV